MRGTAPLQSSTARQREQLRAPVALSSWYSCGFMLNVLDDAKKRGHYKPESVNSVSQLWYLCCGKSASVISFHRYFKFADNVKPRQCLLCSQHFWSLNYKENKNIRMRAIKCQIHTHTHKQASSYPCRLRLLFWTAHLTLDNNNHWDKYFLGKYSY